ncbi:MAG: hypothetical protein PHU77_00320 [Simplicispira sp.]|nr:hypothetical protein [Simplicispira sp.]
MNAVHPTLRQALADCLPPGFRQAPVMHAISIAESAHISRLDAQVAAQAATISALRTEAARKDARIDVMEAALRKGHAPPCPAGQFEHAYVHPELGELECHLEWEQAEPEAGWPEEITLMAAYLCGRDIADRLTKGEVERIEIASAARAKVPA